MAGRTTVYNAGLTTPEKISKINKKNIALLDDFLTYLKSVARAETTIRNYRADLLIFFCWIEDNIDNKYFVNLTKRDIVHFQNHIINELHWSPNRVRTVKAAISSLSNFVENVLDDEVPNYKPIVRRIENPPICVVREKTVYSVDEVQHLLDVLTERQEYEKACFVALAAYSGRRKSELLRFKVSDFDKKKLICGGALYCSDPIQTKGRGGGKYIQCYTLAKKFQPYFDRWMKERSEKGLHSSWLFPHREHHFSQLAATTVDGWKEEFGKITGKPFYPHALRHAFCTYLSEAGIPDKVIQKLVNWSSSDMVRLYTDTSDTTLFETYFKDGDIFVPERKAIENL